MPFSSATSARTRWYSVCGLPVRSRMSLARSFTSRSSARYWLRTAATSASTSLGRSASTSLAATSVRTTSVAMAGILPAKRRIGGLPSSTPLLLLSHVLRGRGGTLVSAGGEGLPRAPELQAPHHGLLLPLLVAGVRRLADL